MVVLLLELPFGIAHGSSTAWHIRGVNKNFQLRILQEETIF